MPSSVIQRSFAGGELGPELGARADQTKYQTGLKTCRNFEVMRHGGVTNRAGLQHLAEVKDSDSRTYLMKFVFNDEQTYVIEVGHEYMRFLREAAQIVTGPSTPYEIATPYQAEHLARLIYVQSGDVITITHPGYATRELKRTGHTAWVLEVVTFAPGVDLPSGVTNNSGAAGTLTQWQVTAIKDETYEESIGSAWTGSANKPTTDAPIAVSWSAVTGAIEYNVYKQKNGVWGFIGTAQGTSFTDDGIDPDTTITPPIARTPFNATGKYPSTATYYQQRRVFGRTDNEPEKIWTTRSGMSKNLSISNPLQDDDAVTFSIAGRKVNEIRHMVEIGELVVLTASGEWIVLGDSQGVLRANQPPNLKQIGYNGSAWVMPVVIGNSLLYVQARGGIPRDLRYEVSSGSTASGYQGRDLTVFAPHLFEGHQIERMDYAQVPHSILRAVRDDGVLLGLTYLREHEVWGWHRHDTKGYFEDVVCVPEGDEDATYVIVRRTINGETKRYIERFASRRFDSILDARFLDSFLVYDGYNDTEITMMPTAEVGWTVDHEIGITASEDYFAASDVGNAISIWREVEVEPGSWESRAVDITISEYVDAQHVVGHASKDVPAELRWQTLTTWSKAVDQVGGLGHLEGEDVSVFADGNVVANPNNPTYDTVTVTDGTITLDRPYSVIAVGLPYTSDFQTLDLDIAGEQLRDRRKLITSISLYVLASRGPFAGETLPYEESVVGLDEMQPEPIANYGDPIPLSTGVIEMPIAATWNQHGSFVVRQSDPLPITILAAVPSGNIGG